MAKYFKAIGNKELALKHAKNAAAITPENKAVKKLLAMLESTSAATIKSNKETEVKEQPVISGKTQSGMTATSNVPAAAVPGIVKSAAELDVTPVQSATDQQALLVWRGINDSTRPVDFELFLKQYDSSPFAGFARERLKELRLGGQIQNRFVEQLANCKAHLQANRLTTGAGGTALDCYRAVLKEDPNNKQALSGIDQIADKYVQWIEKAISQNNEQNARRYIEKLSIVKPVHPQIVSYNEKVDSLSAARQKAKPEKQPYPKVSTHNRRRMTMEYEINRWGQDYRGFNLKTPDPDLCQAACEQEQRCKAWTFVKPDVQSSPAGCWLKEDIAQASPNTRCISGVKHEAIVNSNAYERGKTTSGLFYDDPFVGKGKAVKKDDLVLLCYWGRSKDKEEILFSTYPRNLVSVAACKPQKYKVGSNSFVKGFELGLVGGEDCGGWTMSPMRVGGKRFLKVPPELGWGKKGIPGKVPPDMELVFQIEVIDILKK